MDEPRDSPIAPEDKLETKACLQLNDSTCETERCAAKSFDKVNVNLISHWLERRQIKQVEGVEQIRAKVEFRLFPQEWQPRLFDDREIDRAVTRSAERVTADTCAPARGEVEDVHSTGPPIGQADVRGREDAVDEILV